MYIYFIQIGIDGPIKIGITKDVTSRLRCLETGSPYNLRLLWSYGVDGDGLTEESSLHKWFKYQHIKGEWFRPEPYLIETIERIKTKADFSDDWIEWWNEMSDAHHQLIELTRKYREQGNYYAVRYIANELYELHRDLMENKF